MMKTSGILIIALAVLLTACATRQNQPQKLDDRISAALDEAAASQAKKAADVAKVQDALLPPLKGEIPAGPARLIEPRFDLVVSNAPAQQVFMSIVSGTRYSMLVHPSVSGTISVNLKDVTVQNALDAIRELYGYDFKVDGTRIFIQPATIQTRVFQVNYLIGQRLGRSDVRVTSGSVADAPQTQTAGTAQPVQQSAAGQPGVSDSSRIQTETRSDFWTGLTQTLQAIVGNAEGRSVIVNAQAGVVVVRALPTELRNVETYLKAIRLSVERQVMLEAKIIEVTLSQQYQAGINWAAFPTSGISGGLINNQTSLGTSGALQAGIVRDGAGNITSASVTANPASRNLAAGAAAGALISGVPGGALFGMAFQTQNFAALLQFLESQGTVQVLSSPRIATLNNQKAVLKVGTDDFFLTNIGGSATTATTTGATGTAVPTFPTLTLRPFFSGVALDITPQIDEGSNIILHIHPSVSRVASSERTINLGQFGGEVKLPLASSAVSETDSVVKAADGSIVAIGGLMKVDIADQRSGIPGAQDVPGLGAAFRNSGNALVKKELVILIKPTVIQSDADSSDELRQVRDRIIDLVPAQSGAGGQK